MPHYVTDEENPRLDEVVEVCNTSAPDSCEFIVKDEEDFDAVASAFSDYHDGAPFDNSLEFKGEGEYRFILIGTGVQRITADYLGKED